MTKIDKSKAYMERLAEVLYDEKKVINFKAVSVMLGVHVNVAKQMLYFFYKEEKDKGKGIYAMYFLSGMLPRKVLSEFGDEKEPEEAPQSQSLGGSACDDSDAFLVLVCRDRDLDKYKSKFTKIFSIHIHSLSAFPLENFDPLENQAGQELKDKDGRTPVEFGPIASTTGEKFRSNIRTVPAPAPPPKKEVPKAKESSKIQEEKKSQQDKAEVTDGKSSSDSKDSQKPKVAPPGKNDKDRLKNMFASAASKPKPKKEPVKPETNSSKKESTKSNGDTRKRKRVRDVLSSDSEEEKDSDDEEESPESPIPKRMHRRMKVVDSDSDDDDFKKTPKKEEDTPKTNGNIQLQKLQPKVMAPGRRRVTKYVTKTYTDKDGFLVTCKEQVMVSEDESEDVKVVSGEKGSDNNNSSNTKAPVSSNKSDSKPQEKNKRAEPAQGSKATNGKAATNKPKQQSLMSFFKKK